MHARRDRGSPRRALAALLVVIGCAAAACEAARDAEPPWVTTRDALLGVERDWLHLEPAHTAELREALLGRDGREGDEAVPLGTSVRRGDTLAALAAYDAARLRAGLEPRVSGAFSLDDEGEVLRVASCGALLVALEPPAGSRPHALRLRPGLDTALSARLSPWLPVLADWLESCADAPASDATVQVRLVDGAPVLAAWWPRLGVLELHPALVAMLPAAPDNDFATLVRTVPLGQMSFPFGFDGTYGACHTQLQGWCEQCGSGTVGAGCAPLFSLDPVAQRCDTLDAADPQWRGRYCTWMQAERDPELATCLYDTQAPCHLDITVDIVDLATLMAAVPVACSLDFATCEPTAPPPPPPLPTWTGSAASCVGELESWCSACLSTPGSDCSPLFEGSNAVQDCSDLQRDELYGNGFAAYCAQQMTRQNLGQRICLNAAVTCVAEPDGATDVRFQPLIANWRGFVAPETAARCLDQLDRCLVGQPLDPIDLDALQPGAEPESPTSGSKKEDGGKCFE